MGILDRLRRQQDEPAHEEPAPQEAPAFDLEQHIAQLAGDVLVVTPLYPSEQDPYACAFVHSRVVAYRKAGLSVDVVSQAFDGNSFSYSFEGVPVLCLAMADLLHLLRTRHYRTIAVHFIENDYARVLESCDLSRSHLVFWGFAGASLYWDRPMFTTPYFQAPRIMPPDELDELHRRDATLARLDKRPNTTFVFDSDFVYERSRELTGIDWQDYRVIPNIIDPDTFVYRQKTPDMGKRVFTAKKQIDTSNYAMDLVVRTILELSRRPCFDQMSFTIVGNGEAHDKLVAPIRDFPNVRLVERFLTHDEIAAEHAQHGVALFPTRYDGHGVSMCEAALSGLAVVSTKRDSVAAFLSDHEGLLVETNDHMAYADTLQRLSEDADYFQECCRASHDKVAETCSAERTIEREIKLLSDTTPPQEPPAYSAPEQPVLTLAALGADESALGALRLLAAEQGRGSIEVLGADTPAQAARQARGTYVRLVGARDFCDPQHTQALVDYLAQAGEDVVLSDWWQADERTDTATRMGGFHFMLPHQRYSHFDLELETYGFGGDWPGMEACTLQRAWLARLVEEAGEDAVLEQLLGETASLAGSLSYLPLPAYVVRG